MRRFIQFLSAGGVVGLILLLAHTIGYLQPLERKLASLQTLDSFSIGDVPVAVIEISDLGNNPWPWARLDYTLILRAVSAFDSKLVAIEIPLVGSDTFYTNYDHLLADANKKVPRVIYAAAALTIGEPALLPNNIRAIPYEGIIQDFPEYVSTFLPNPIFARGGEIGFSNLGYDADGIVRKTPLIYRFGAQLAPSWALSIYGTSLGVDWLKSRVILGKEIILKNSQDKILQHIPIDESGRMKIHFREKRRILRIEFGNALLSSEQIFSKQKPTVDLNLLKGKCVIIGRAHPDTVNKIRTPIGEMYPVDVHLQTLANLFQSDFQRTLPDWISWTAIVLLAAFASSVMMISRKSIRFSCAIMLLMFAVLFKIIFSILSLVAPVATFGCAILAGILAGSVMSFSSRR